MSAQARNEEQEQPAINMGQTLKANQIVDKQNNQEQTHVLSESDFDRDMSMTEQQSVKVMHVEEKDFDQQHVGAEIRRSSMLQSFQNDEPQQLDMERASVSHSEDINLSQSFGVRNKDKESTTQQTQQQHFSP